MRHDSLLSSSIWSFAVVLGATACNPATGHSNLPNVERPVKTFTVQTGVGDRVRVLPGRVEAAAEVDLAFRVSGPLVAIDVDEGSKVAAGQALARVDPRDYRVRVRSAEARLQAAKAQLKHASNEHARFQRLAKDDAAPQARLDDAAAALEIARSDRTAAERSLEAAKLALRDTVLRAPFAGRIARRRVDNHQTISAGQPVLLIQGSGPPEVHVDVPEGALRGFLAAEPKMLSVEFPTFDDARRPVRIVSHQGDIDRQTKTYEAVLALDEKVVGVEPGMTATVRWVKPGRAEGIVVPMSAVGAEPGGEPIVYRLRDRVLERVAVELGPVTAAGIEIRAGVEVGDVLLAAGVRAAAPGQRVRPIGPEDLGG